jgi:hypothetical protein
MGVSGRPEPPTKTGFDTADLSDASWNASGIPAARRSNDSTRISEGILNEFRDF